jgi:putative addiction module antidote
MTELKLTRIGNSLGVILPKEVLVKLRIEQGESLYLTESLDGFRLTPNDPNFASQMTAARAIMRKRRAALNELAK